MAFHRIYSDGYKQEVSSFKCLVMAVERQLDMIALLRDDFFSIAENCVSWFLAQVTYLP